MELVSSTQQSDSTIDFLYIYIYIYIYVYIYIYIPFQILFHYSYYIEWASYVVLMAKNPPVNSGEVRDTGSIPGSGRSPEGGHGTHSSILAWRIP